MATEQNQDWYRDVSGAAALDRDEAKHEAVPEILPSPEDWLASVKEIDGGQVTLLLGLQQACAELQKANDDTSKKLFETKIEEFTNKLWVECIANNNLGVIHYALATLPETGELGVYFGEALDTLYKSVTTFLKGRRELINLIRIDLNLSKEQQDSYCQKLCHVTGPSELAQKKTELNQLLQDKSFRKMMDTLLNKIEIVWQNKSKLIHQINAYPNLSKIQKDSYLGHRALRDDATTHLRPANLNASLKVLQRNLEEFVQKKTELDQHIETLGREGKLLDWEIKDHTDDASSATSIEAVKKVKEQVDASVDLNQKISQKKNNLMLQLDDLTMDGTLTKPLGDCYRARVETHWTSPSNEPLMTLARIEVGIKHEAKVSRKKAELVELVNGLDAKGAFEEKQSADDFLASIALIEGGGGHPEKSNDSDPLSLLLELEKTISKTAGAEAVQEARDEISQISKRVSELTALWEQINWSGNIFASANRIIQIINHTHRPLREKLRALLVLQDCISRMEHKRAASPRAQLTLSIQKEIFGLVEQLACAVANNPQDINARKKARGFIEALKKLALNSPTAKAEINRLLGKAQSSVIRDYACATSLDIPLEIDIYRTAFDKMWDEAHWQGHSLTLLDFTTSTSAPKRAISVWDYHNNSSRVNAFLSTWEQAATAQNASRPLEPTNPTAKRSGSFFSSFWRSSKPPESAAAAAAPDESKEDSQPSDFFHDQRMFLGELRGIEISLLVSELSEKAKISGGLEGIKMTKRDVLQINALVSDLSLSKDFEGLSKYVVRQVKSLRAPELAAPYIDQLIKAIDGEQQPGSTLSELRDLLGTLKANILLIQAPAEEVRVQPQAEAPTMGR